MDSGMSVWVPLISAGAGILGALGSQWLSHIFISRREKRASVAKQNLERYFIATELVFLLEKFAQNCVSPATDLGGCDDKGRYFLRHNLPGFNYSAVTGDWRSLPNSLIYSLSELPVLHEEARRHIESAEENDDPYDGSLTINAIRSESSRLGMRAIQLSRQLRDICKMPPDELANYSWSAWNVLNKAHLEFINAFVKQVRAAQQGEVTAGNIPERSSGEKK